MVDFRSADSCQWDSVNPTSNRHDSIDQRVKERLGSLFSSPEDRCSVAERGSQSSHQCAGIEGSLSGSSSICEKSTTSNPHSAATGQLDSSVVHKQARGTHSPSLVSLAPEIWNFCISHKICLTASHVPGVTNIHADFASRNFNNCTEWTLDKMVFQKITNRFYIPEVDLFASCINNLLPRYVARYPDPASIATDAFLQHWGQWTVFIHAPIVPLPCILQKIQHDQATGLVIAPTWVGQPWYPTLLELLVDFPAQLPITEGTISLPINPQAIHPMW